MTITATTVMLLMMTIMCTSIAQILQKQAAIELNAGGSSKTSLLNPAIVKSMALLACGMGLWLLVLNRMDVSVAYPLLSANFIVVHLLAHWKLGEEITANRVIGAVIIIVGMAFLFSGSTQ